MKRKALSLILAFAMAVSLFTVGASAAEPTYGDTAGHWAEASIERWSAYGIIQGSNGQFDPNGQLTCAQLATILAKLLKLPAAKDAGFSDNKADAWYYDAINRCAAAGILNGNGDGTVTPEAPITRERAMVMLARALGIEPIRKPDLTKYTDAAQVSAYAQGYVAALIEAGIVGGVTAGELAPQDNINRASTVTILDRAISTYADQAGATVKADGKGIVLVVAENVKITGAPEGTKIVVADGATGLTVNGKSVSDDQTYIVPKAEPAKPSSSSSGGSVHAHDYTIFVTDWSTMTTVKKCSCGATQTVVNSDTYYIANDTDLKAFRDKVNVGDAFVGKTIQLTDNINLKNEAWTPIGTAEHPFEGTFDGQGHKITGLTNKSDATSFGLFEKVKGTVVIKNFELTVNAVAADDVNSEGWAGVVGLSNGETCDLTLENITVKGILTAKDKVAGLIAQAPTYANNGSKLTVKKCVNEAAVTGDRAAGICCAINHYAETADNTFEKCVNKGTITAKSGKYQTAAGIVCKNEAGTVFTDCSNTGKIDAKIGYTIATKVVITFTENHRAGSARVEAGDTYYYTQINPNIETMHNLFVGEPYSAETAVDWEQVCRTAHVADYVGLGAGIWYDTEHKDDYKVAVNAWYHPNDEDPYELTTKRYFKTIDEAFEHDLYNATITLSADQTLTKTKADQMTYTIDLGGKTLTASSTIHDGINGGTITIKNGTIVQAGDNKLFEITNKGTLKLENVKIASEDKCIARIAAAYTGTIIFDKKCSISGYIDLSGNPATKVVINGTTYSREAGLQYIYIKNNKVYYSVSTAAEAQKVLDAATPGTTIQLSEGVNYGVLYLRPIEGSPATKTVDWQGNNYRWETYTLFENLTIIGAEGAKIDAIEIEGGTYYNTAHSQYSTHPIMLSLIELKGVVIEGVTFTGNGGRYGDNHGNAICLAGNNIKVDGLTLRNCVLEDSTKNNRLLYKTESTTQVHTYTYGDQTYTFTPSLEDITVTGCTFNGGYMGLELRETKNVTITGNTFNGLSSRNILLPTNSGCTYSGTVTITDNTSDGAVERFVRADQIGDARLIITGNTITNYTGNEADYIKVTGATGETTIEDNTLVVVMTANTSDFVAAMQKVPAGVAKITLVDAEGDIGIVIAPDGYSSTITVYSKEGLLYLNTLFDNWVACFTDGSGGEYSNYVPVNGGKGEDYYYSGRWTIVLDADIDLNNDTIAPVAIKHPVSADTPTFNGNNHTIKNAKIVMDATAENAAGLFDASSVAFKDLKLDNIQVTGSNVGNSTAGVLSGSCNFPIENITITNSSVTGGKYTGGVVGYGYTSITNCTLTNVTVKGGYKLGGIIGYICASGKNTGNVTGNTLTDCTVDGIGGGVYAGGKDKYIIGKVVGNYNCNGTCNSNTITGMTTSATANIGEIEAGKAVTQ